MRCGPLARVVRPGARVRRALAVGLVAVAGVGAPTPATACTCGTIPGQLPITAADVAFSGTALARRDPPPLATASPSGGRFVPDVDTPIVYTFAVDGVAKGWVARQQEVTTGHSNCAAFFELGHRYEVYATRTARGLMTSLCAWNRPLAAGAAPLGPRSAAPRNGPLSAPPAILVPLVLLAGGAALASWRGRPIVWRRGVPARRE